MAILTGGLIFTSCLDYSHEYEDKGNAGDKDELEGLSPLHSSTVAELA